MIIIYFFAHVKYVVHKSPSYSFSKKKHYKNSKKSNRKKRKQILLKEPNDNSNITSIQLQLSQINFMFMYQEKKRIICESDREIERWTLNARKTSFMFSADKHAELLLNVSSEVLKVEKL